jgi:hypothetical protein
MDGAKRRFEAVLLRFEDGGIQESELNPEKVR